MGPLELWLLPEELPLLGRLPPVLLPELPLEPRELLEPALDEELLALGLPLLPLQPELGLAGPEPEEPELCMKFWCGTSRCGSGDLRTPGEGAGSAGAEVAPEPDPLLLPPLRPELGAPPEPELGAGVGESRVMLEGNWRRDSGIRSRPEEGEESGAEVTPEPPPEETPEPDPLPEPELVMTPPDWPPAARWSRALRIASSRSTSRPRPAGRRTGSTAGCPLPPDATGVPEPLPETTEIPWPPEEMPRETGDGVATPPEPLPPAVVPPLLPRRLRFRMRCSGPGS